MLRRSAFILLFLLPCVLIWTEITLYSENSLYRHPEWIVGKRKLGFSVVGTDEFLITQSSLAQNQLHLGKWFGFQEVTNRRQLTPRKIHLEATLDENAYLYILFGDSKNLAGIRFSNNTNKPTAFVTASTLGEIFEEKILSNTTSKGRHDIQFAWNAGQIKIWVDHLVVYEGHNFPEQGQLTLRGGREDARIGHIQIEERDGTVHNETFRNTQKGIQILALLTAFFLIIGLVLYLMKDKKAALFTYVTFLLTMGLIGGSYYLFDFYVWSSIEQSHLTKPLPQQAELKSYALEVARYNFFHSIARWAGVNPITQENIIAMGYPARRYTEGPLYCDSSSWGCKALEPDQNTAVVHDPKKGLRILFIGTSQTVGAGAENIHQTFFALVHGYLQSHLKTSLESMNMAVSGSHAKELIQKYHEVYQPFSADIVIINLAFNDEPQQMLEQLPPFIKELRGEGKQVLLIQEAISLEDHKDTRGNREALAQIGTQQNVPILPLHDYLNDSATAKKGMLWWDAVHLTPYGQKLAGDWLGPRILEVIKRIP